MESFEAKAEKALQAMVAELRHRGLTAVCAVCDSHGELLALFRRDGAPLSSVRIAENKAYTAARQRKSSRAVGVAARDTVTGYDIAYYGDPRYLGWAGGLPVLSKGEVVAAVAVSGLTQDVDEEIAEIGRSAFEAV